MSWHARPYECTFCGWQGLRDTEDMRRDEFCPECGEAIQRRSWQDTWGVTLLIFAVVIAVVLFAGYAPTWLR